MNSSDTNETSRRAGLAIAATAALVIVGVVALLVQRSSTSDATPAASTTSAITTTIAPTTTTTTVPETTTTTSTTTTSTTTTSTTTTTTVPPPTTILDSGVPIWEPYEPKPPLVGIAALTGEPADESITNRPILAVKIDNSPNGRPQWGLDEADAIIEENVEGVTRFVALFQTQLPDRVGPVRSARTGDLDLLAAMNRPILGWSGGNRGVTRWIESAASSGILVDFSGQKSPCYNRSSSRRSPHNFLLNPSCAVETATTAGPARKLWEHDSDWIPGADAAVTPDTSFEVGMDGVRVGWTWDDASGTYLRSQNGRTHVAVSGAQISAKNVVEIKTFHAPSPVDARSPNPITVGGTDAVVHRDGIAIAATWYRVDAYSSFSFFDAESGARIPLDTGTTFIELVRDRPK